MNLQCTSSDCTDLSKQCAQQRFIAFLRLKDLYIEVSAHFGIESVENLAANRRNRFINRYGETDNY